VKDIWDDDAEEGVDGSGDGGELAVWKLSGDAECTLEAPQVETETLRDVMIRRKKRTGLDESIRKRRKSFKKRDCEERKGGNVE
jgi:hypothetical protein